MADRHNGLYAAIKMLQRMLMTQGDLYNILKVIRFYI